MRLAMLAAIYALAVVAVPDARAFTLESPGGSSADQTPRFTDPDESTQHLIDPSVSTSSRSRLDPLDRWRNPDRLPPIPEGARIGAGEHGFGNNSRYGYDRSGRPR